VHPQNRSDLLVCAATASTADNKRNGMGCIDRRRIPGSGWFNSPPSRMPLDGGGTKQGTLVCSAVLAAWGCGVVALWRRPRSPDSCLFGSVSVPVRRRGSQGPVIYLPFWVISRHLLHEGPRKALCGLDSAMTRSSRCGLILRCIYEIFSE